jgi:hypothetical protein
MIPPPRDIPATMPTTNKDVSSQRTCLSLMLQRRKSTLPSVVGPLRPTASQPPLVAPEPAIPMVTMAARAVFKVIMGMYECSSIFEGDLTLLLSTSTTDPDSTSSQNLQTFTGARK